MNIKYKPIQRLIQEAISSPCFDKFGRYLFGDIDNFYNGIAEPNTKYEENMKQLLVRFLWGDWDNKEKEQQIITALEELKQCTKHYPTVLYSPTGIYYRGSRILQSEAKKLKWKLSSTHPDMVVATYVYSPRSSVQSWSKDYDRAKHFALINERENYFGCIIEANLVSKDSLFNFKFLNKFAEDVLGVEEFETVRMSKKPLKCKIYVKREDLK